MVLDRDALARSFQESNRDILELAQLQFGTLLEKYLSSLRDIIESVGLTDLYWVTGIHTEEIASCLIEALEIGGLLGDASGEKFRIVVRPTEFPTVELLSSRYGMKVSTMSDFFVDSFLVVNENVVLDLTPVATDDGDPEYSSDPTIVGLYLGLFNMLRNSSIPTIKIK